MNPSTNGSSIGGEGVGERVGISQQPNEPSLSLNHHHHALDTLQRVSLDKAVAPLLSRPTAPFDRTERKKAHTSAVYYSECFLNGIEPIVADTAAVEAQGQYDKWWIKRTASTSCKKEERKNKERHSRKSKHKRQSSTGDLQSKKRKCKTSHVDDDISINSGPAVVSVSNTYVERQTGVNCDHSSSDESMPDSQSERLGHRVPIEHVATLSTTSKSSIEAVKMRLIENLRISGGNIETAEVLECMEVLETYYARSGVHRLDPSTLEGNWLTISKPTYTECKGKNEKGESIYTLGRIGFDMYKPLPLLCSVQASFNNVQPIDPKNPGRPLHVPRKLMHEIRKGECQLQSYE
jgi:hypothetical protein